MSDTQSLDGIFKDYYEDYVSEGVNNKNPLKDLIKFVDIPYGGREVKWAAHVGRSAAVMPSGEGGGFPEPGNEKTIQTSITAKKLVARIETTPEALADSMKSEYAFVSARKDESNRMVDNIARREEHLLCQDGRGVLALVDAADPDATTTVALDAPGGITNDNFGNRYVQPGMYVSFVNPATGQLRASSARKVVSCDENGSDIVLESVTGTAVVDSDYVVQAANGSITDLLDTSYEQAFWGVMALFDDGTYRNNYFGIDRSQFPSHSTYVKASTGAFSIDVLQQNADVIDQKLNAKTTRMVLHHDTRRLYIQALEQDRRYINASLQRPDGGTAAFKGEDLTMGEVPLTVIRDFPLDIILGLDEKEVGLTCYVSEKGKWDDTDGSIWVRSGTGSSARHKFEAWYYSRKQFCAKNPGKAWRADGITGQTFIAVRAE